MASPWTDALATKFPHDLIFEYGDSPWFVPLNNISHILKPSTHIHVLLCLVFGSQWDGTTHILSKFQTDFI